MLSLGHAAYFGFELTQLGRGKGDEVIDTVQLRLLTVLGEGLDLRLIGRDDDLADPPMRNRVLGAVLIECTPARHAQPCLERAAGIIDAGVYDLGVAGTGVGTESRLGLQHHHLPTAPRELAGNCEADDAGADDCTINSFRHAGP